MRILGEPDPYTRPLHTSPQRGDRGGRSCQTSQEPTAVPASHREEIRERQRRGSYVFRLLPDHHTRNSATPRPPWPQDEERSHVSLYADLRRPPATTSATDHGGPGREPPPDSQRHEPNASHRQGIQPWQSRGAGAEHGDSGEPVRVERWGHIVDSCTICMS